MKIALVVPTYNERNNIRALIEKTKNVVISSGHQPYFVIVDDSSPDGTADVVRSIIEEDKKRKDDSSIHLLSRPQKMGLGSAYCDAFKWILNKLPFIDVIIQMDADLSHPPELIAKMIDAISKEDADVTIASRYAYSGGVDNWPLHRRIISKGANLFARMFLGIKIKDATSGFRAIKIQVVRELLKNKMNSRGYEYQVESIYFISKAHKKIEEVPFTFKNRMEGKSKLTLVEIWRFASTVLHLRLESLSGSMNEVNMNAIVEEIATDNNSNYATARSDQAEAQ